MAANERKVLFVNAEGDHEEHNFNTDQIKLAKLVLDTNNATTGETDALVITEGDLNLSGVAQIKGLVNPSSPQDAATKQYVDATSTGLDVKDSVRFGSIADAAAAVYVSAGTYGEFGATLTAAAVGAIDLDAAFEMGGLTPVLGDRVLVKNQSSGFQNGIYTITDLGDIAIKWELTRALDADNSDNTDANAVTEVTEGMFSFIEEGASLGDTGWVLSSDTTPDLTSVAVSFSQFSSAGVVIGGDNVIRDGNAMEYRSTLDTITLGQGTGNADTAIEVDMGFALSAVGDGAEGSRAHQVKASADPANNGLIISDDAISDYEVMNSAGIQASKIELGGDAEAYDAATAKAAYEASSNAFAISTSASQTVQDTLEDMEGYLDSLNAVTDGFAGADKIANTAIDGFASTSVQGVLEEVTGPELLSSAGVAKGDVVYMDSSTGLGTYDATTSTDRPIGVAPAIIGVSGTGKVLTSGMVYDSGATPFTVGLRYFWTGSAFTSTMPSTSGQYVYQVGTAISTGKLLIDIDFVKKNV